MYDRQAFYHANRAVSLSAQHERMIIYARGSSDELRHIDEVPNGKACGCMCLACGDSLIARHGEVKAHHFAHESGADCAYGFETMLHVLAKQLLQENLWFVTPSIFVSMAHPGLTEKIELSHTIREMNIRIDSARLEQRIHSVRPDLVLAYADRELLVEIAVTHKVDARKRAKLKELGLPAVEIDLADWEGGTIEQFRRLLVEATPRKSWLFNPKVAEIESKLALEIDRRLASQRPAYDQMMAEKQTRDRIAEIRMEKLLREEREYGISSKAARAGEKEALDRLGERRGHVTSIGDRPESKIRYQMPDGYVWQIRAPNGLVQFYPDTGGEAILKEFERLGVTYDRETRSYNPSAEQLPKVLMCLNARAKARKSIS